VLSEPCAWSGVKVRFVDPDVCPPQLPASDKFVSRVTSLAMEEAADGAYDVVFSHYMEPYGVAAFLGSRLLGIPWVHRHAGSDLVTLGESPALGPLYRELLRTSSMVVACPDLHDYFLSLGVRRERLKAAPLFVPDPAVFSPEGPPAAWANLPAVTGAPPPPDHVPLVLMYGKTGNHKGQVDLIRAAAQIKQSFFLLFVTSSVRHEWLLRQAAHFGIESGVACLPFLPNWLIPGLIRRSAVACQLEHDFPIRLHRSAIPYEIMTCGGCLMVSTEIYGKQLKWLGAEDGTHLCVVAPVEVDSLARTLDHLLREASLRQRIAEQGRQLILQATSHAAFVRGYEQLFAELRSQQCPTT